MSAWFRFCICSFEGTMNEYSSLAQSVEHAAVNRSVVGSSPTGGAFLCQKRVWEGSGRNEIDETCKIQENVSCRFFCYTDICQVRFYRYIVVQDNFIYVLKFCNLYLLLFVLLVKGL